ncbi:hypothetical protein EK904_013370 [Melospiza melodia maxima]|nr:hypothetical protein EK904_013370 [Melospiza melodia maxima]
MAPALPWVIPLGCVLLLTETAESFILPNSSHLESILSKYQDGEAHSRSKRAILFSDRQEILMLHNKLRGQVYPVASNMEYMKFGSIIHKGASGPALDASPVMATPQPASAGSSITSRS